MRLSQLAVLGLFTLVQAHFQLSFPVPRGPFVEDDEPTFCDNYVNAVSNRTQFPLSGGFFTLNSEHPSWVLGVLLSTDQDPSSFNDFKNSSGSDQLARNYATATGEGEFCIPLNLSNTGISGVQSGANVTLQFVFDGGDGQLFQCTDLTLSDSATIEGQSCQNATGSPSSTSSSASSPSSSSSSSSTNSNGAIARTSAGYSALFLAVGGTLLSTM
ncbi:hypothetical protein OF83DRAFT_1134233 [Amylostereum chailletii]|nr:hypothetical protein OF83DRAFT_1134233 [Amylostereum chailletii]